MDSDEKSGDENLIRVGEESTDLDRSGFLIYAVVYVIETSLVRIPLLI